LLEKLYCVVVAEVLCPFDEEKNADKLLTRIAKASSNRKAMAAE
jgi:hypothetical protein